MRVGFEIGTDEPGRHLVDVFDGETEEQVGNGQVIGGRAMGAPGEWAWIVGDSQSDWTAEGTARTWQLAERDLITAATAHWETGDSQ